MEFVDFGAFRDYDPNGWCVCVCFFSRGSNRVRMNYRDYEEVD